MRLDVENVPHNSRMGTVCGRALVQRGRGVRRSRGAWNHSEYDRNHVCGHNFQGRREPLVHYDGQNQMPYQGSVHRHCDDWVLRGSETFSIQSHV